MKRHEELIPVVAEFHWLLECGFYIPLSTDILKFSYPQFTALFYVKSQGKIK